jgi:hypothetical protein
MVKELKKNVAPQLMPCREPGPTAKDPLSPLALSSITIVSSKPGNSVPETFPLTLSVENVQSR